MSLVTADENTDLSHLTDLIQETVDRLELPGAAALVETHDGRVLYERVFGSVTMSTVMAIASASKWLTVATVMALVDDGVLSLDRPVAAFLPEFRSGRKQQITLRQCLACTSGMMERIPEIYDTGLDFAEVVSKVAAQDLRADPGSELSTGAPGSTWLGGWRRSPPARAGTSCLPRRRRGRWA